MSKSKNLTECRICEGAFSTCGCARHEENKKGMKVYKSLACLGCFWGHHFLRYETKAISSGIDAFAIECTMNDALRKKLLR